MGAVASSEGSSMTIPTYGLRDWRARAGLTTCLPPQLCAEPDQKPSPWVRLGLQLVACSWRGGAGKWVLTR
jgi:hypothetical protein